jgi:nicotinamide-nucleotide amidase
MSASLGLQEVLIAKGATVATAESLTGGLLGGCFTAEPGSSRVYVGGVVAYATRLKVAMLGVSQTIIDGPGVVSSECAVAMAAGVRTLTGATFGLSTTGVAGPNEQEGKQAGTVFIAVAGPAGARTVALEFSGDRMSIRRQAVEAALLVLRTEMSKLDECG